MIVVDIDMPENTLDCPFIEVDYETNELYCSLRPVDDNDGRCSGLCNYGCYIKKGLICVSEN